MNTAKKKKIIIFSKDRPLQLDLCIQTLNRNCFGRLPKIDVIYKATSEEYAMAYKTCTDMYFDCDINFIPETDFQQNFLNSLNDTDFVMLVVDDTIFCRRFDIDKICDAITNSVLLGFSLRLGRNINYCYPYSCHQSQPVFYNITHEFLKYYWSNCSYDFGYPMEVSSSIYPTKTIKMILEDQKFNNPNELEDAFYTSKNKFWTTLSYLGCYNYSVAFSNAINKVQTVNNNRSGSKQKYSKEALLKRFVSNYRANPSKFDGFMPVSPHQEVEILEEDE